MPGHKKTCRLDRSDDGDNRFIAHDSAMHRGRFDYGSMLNGFSFTKVGQQLSIQTLMLIYGLWQSLIVNDIFANSLRATPTRQTF